MKIEHIIFDLDGTLVDSSDGILAAFGGSLNAFGITPTCALTPEIIGPPLKQTLALLTGKDESSLMDQIVTSFKTYYDTEGYLLTTDFPGVSELLSDLAQKGVSLYLATNKRIIPTSLILDIFNWRRFFTGVFALDSVTPPATSKSELLAKIINQYGLNESNTLYVGDRKEDAIAARSAKISFAYASWGYGGDVDDAACEELFLKCPASLISLLSRCGG